MAQTSATTYKISFKKIARAALAEVRIHKKLAIITLVLYGVSIILALFNWEAYYYHDMGYGTASFVPSTWGLLFACAGVIVSYFTALNVFRDMNNQQLCDVSMALPIKASERFLSKLLSLVYLQIAPLIIATLGGNGIALICAMIKLKTTDIPSASEYLFSIVFGCFAASLFIMAIAVLSACCCGAFAESAYFSLILMFIINAMPLAYINNVICGSAGINISFLDTDTIIDLGYWGLIYVFGYVDDLIPHCAVNCAISLAVMLLSGLIYVKRDAKTVGTPIASRLFFEIIMFTGCVTVFSFSVMSDLAFWGLLIAGVIYIIINIIVSRAKINLLSFLKWAGKYAATAAVFAVLLIATIKTGGFGLINSRPETKYLDSAKFSINYNTDYYVPNYGYQTSFESAPLTAEQANEVITICKKHIIKGRSEINVADIIFGRHFESSTARVRVTANSLKRFNEKPFSMTHFETYRSNGHDIVYGLYFSQYIAISRSDAEAMIKELTDLGYIHPQVEDELYDTSSATGSAVYY